MKGVAKDPTERDAGQTFAPGPDVEKSIPAVAMMRGSDPQQTAVIGEAIG